MFFEVKNFKQTIQNSFFKSGELEEGSVTEKISATAADGKMYMTKFYNLDAEKVNLQVVRNSSQYAT